MVAEFAEVLERLENVRLALATSGGRDDLADLLAGRGAAKVIVKLLLDIRKVAVIVLDDLGREIGENVLFESTEKERQDLLMEGVERKDG